MYAEISIPPRSSACQARSGPAESRVGKYDGCNRAGGSSETTQNNQHARSHLGVHAVERGVLCGLVEPVLGQHVVVQRLGLRLVQHPHPDLGHITARGDGGHTQEDRGLVSFDLKRPRVIIKHECARLGLEAWRTLRPRRTGAWPACGSTAPWAVTRSASAHRPGPHPCRGDGGHTQEDRGFVSFGLRGSLTNHDKT